MNILKERLRGLIRATGYDVVPYKRQQRGLDPFLDIRFFLQAVTSPVIADVGANVGQSILRFKAIAPSAEIHSFEPSISSFAKLKQNQVSMGWKHVHLWNHGVGANNTMLPLLENEQSVMSSFLAPGELCPGQIIASTVTPIMSLDSFAASQGIPFIDVIKCDTQGFEYEVFKGAKGLFSEHRVGMILFECIVSDQYKGKPGLEQILEYLAEHQFSMVAIYNQKFQRNLLSWMDILVINQTHYRRASQSERA